MDQRSSSPRRHAVARVLTFLGHPALQGIGAMVGITMEIGLVRNPLTGNELAPEYGQVYYARARAREKLRDIAGAIEDLNRYLRFLSDPVLIRETQQYIDHLRSELSVHY